MIIYNKQGFHTASGGGNTNGWGEWWNTINDRGFALNAITADSAGFIYEIQQANKNPNNTLVFRFSLWQGNFDPNTPDYRANPESEAERMLTTKWNLFPSELNQNFIWLKDTNEIRTKINNPEDAFWNNLSAGEWWGRYALRAAQLTVQNNKRVILLSPSSGDHTYEFWEQPSMILFLKYAVQHKDRIAVGLHEYSYTKDNILHPFNTLEEYRTSPKDHRKIGRFEVLFDVCDRNNVGDWPMLYFCEWGWEERNIPLPERALDDIRLVTQNVYGPFYKYILGFGTWYLGPNFDPVQHQTNQILLPCADLSTQEGFRVEERTPRGANMNDCPAIVDVRTTSIWIPQFSRMTDSEIEQVTLWAKHGFPLPNGQNTGGEHMLCPSHVDALRIHTQGLPGSILGIAFPEKVGNGVTLQWIQENCPCALQDGKQVVFLGGNTTDSPFLRLPTDSLRLSQIWGENPQDYIQFGLPAHNGIDVPIPIGTPLYATVEGIVTRRTTTGNYGNRVAIQATKDGLTYELTFAHLQSFNVSVGQPVNPNTIVGYSGNTGNSTGPHLHYGIRVLNRTYTDSFGVWPNNHHNPMLWTAELYSKAITGISGYLYLPSLKVDDTSNIAYARGNLNLREQPSASSRLLGQVLTGQVVEILNTNPTNNYVLCRTQLTNPPPTVRADYGLHLRADPDTPSQAEFNIVQSQLQRGGKTVKLLHNHPANVFNQVKSYNPQYVMIRIMQHWGNRNITQEQFYQWNVDELIQKVNTLGTGITKIIEVANEPNLYEEGFGYSWNNGFQFAQWFNQTVTLFKSRAELRNLQFAYPGLSPGGSIPNIRYDSNAFLTESLSAGLNADVFCCHAYWSDHYPITTAIQDVQNFKNRVPNKDLYVTEASRNDRPATKTAQQYGQEYANFVKSVNAKAVYFFVGSASNGYFEPETWVTESGQDKGINATFLSSL